MNRTSSKKRAIVAHKQTFSLSKTDPIEASQAATSTAIFKSSRTVMLTSFVERKASEDVTFENSGVKNGVFSIREANNALQEF